MHELDANIRELLEFLEDAQGGSDHQKTIRLALGRLREMVILLDKWEAKRQETSRLHDEKKRLRKGTDDRPPTDVPEGEGGGRSA